MLNLCFSCNYDIILWFFKIIILNMAPSPTCRFHMLQPVTVGNWSDLVRSFIPFCSPHSNPVQSRNNFLHTVASRVSCCLKMVSNSSGTFLLCILSLLLYIFFHLWSWVARCEIENSRQSTSRQLPAWNTTKIHFILTNATMCLQVPLTKCV